MPVGTHNASKTRCPRGHKYDRVRKRDGARECSRCAKELAAERQRRRKLEQPDAVRDAWLKKNYGISLAEYEALFEAQNGVCAICGQPETRRRANGTGIASLVVDHDHESGVVRALLCHACNAAIGLMKESQDRLMAAVRYLIEHSTKAEV